MPAEVDEALTDLMVGALAAGGLQVNPLCSWIDLTLFDSTVCINKNG